MTVTQRRAPASAKVTGPIPIQAPDTADEPEAAEVTAEATAGRTSTSTEIAVLRASVEIAGPRPARYGIQMPRRRPGFVWLGQTVTLGIGHLRWLRRVSRELADLDERAAVDLRRTTLAIAPGVLVLIPACLAWYRLGRRIARAQYAAGLLPTCRPGRGVLLAFALGAVAPYYQRELNKIIDWYGFPPDAPVPLYD